MGLLATIACVVATMGPCGSPPTPAPLPVSRFALDYQRSGGIAASSQKLKIGPGREGDASVSIRSGTGGETRAVRFRLPVPKIKQLRNAFSDSRFPLLESGSTESCADCYVYSLVYRGHSVNLAETEVPIWLRKTIGRLEALVENHLPFH